MKREEELLLTDYLKNFFYCLDHIDVFLHYFASYEHEWLRCKLCPRHIHLFTLIKCIDLLFGGVGLLFNNSHSPGVLMRNIGAEVF